MNRRDYIWSIVVGLLLLCLVLTFQRPRDAQALRATPLSRSTNELAWLTKRFADAEARGILIDFPAFFVKDTPDGPRWSEGYNAVASPPSDEAAIGLKLAMLSRYGLHEAILNSADDTSVRTIQTTLNLFHEHGINKVALFWMRFQGVYIEPQPTDTNIVAVEVNAHVPTHR